MLAAIWGVESNFGSEMGERPLVQSLSTLACYGERAGYFRSELMAALKIIDRGDIPAEKLAGSWAGAFGQTQFMPSSYLRLRCARERRRARHRRFGRRRARPRPRTTSPSRAGGRASPGVSRSSCRPAIRGRPDARRRRRCRPGPRAGSPGSTAGRSARARPACCCPPARDGPAFLVTHNFDVVYSYNAAESYSLAACVLADRLAGGQGIVAPWPTDDPGLSRAERRELQTLLARRGYDVGQPGRRDRQQDQGGDRRL